MAEFGVISYSIGKSMYVEAWQLETTSNINDHRKIL